MRVTGPKHHKENHHFWQKLLGFLGLPTFVCCRRKKSSKAFGSVALDVLLKSLQLPGEGIFQKSVLEAYAVNHAPESGPPTWAAARVKSSCEDRPTRPLHGTLPIPNVCRILAMAHMISTDLGSFTRHLAFSGMGSKLEGCSDRCKMHIHYILKPLRDALTSIDKHEQTSAYTYTRVYIYIYSIHIHT